jgi:hypothetical protein
MKITCDIKIEYDDEKKANTVLKSIETDNLNYIKSSINGKQLETHFEGKTVSSILHTLDDYLVCISVVEKIIDEK